jgi:Holliday junction resolvase-like predicted endonuclease
VVARAEKLRFVEVKARSANHDYEPVHPGQVRRLTTAADAWMAAQPSAWWSEACFVLAVVDTDGRIGWLDDPF